MRIDVEVYKGPLAQDPWTQFGELAGALKEAGTAFRRFEEGLKKSDLGIKCEAADGKAKRTGSELGRSCHHVIELLEDAGAVEQLQSKLSELARTLSALEFWKTNIDDKQREVRQALRDVVEVATRLRGKAYFYAGNQVVEVPWNRELRGYMATFAFLSSEYSNQIGTRADALLQQMAGPDRRELPLSLQLRNTNPSEFLNVFIWNRAGGLAIWEDWFLRPHVAFSKAETAERVRTYEQLFGDYNWSNINAVYASGQGDVSMAFVKDDIGNWNLKTFDNDPTELLKAYVEVGKAALQEAVRAVAASTGVGAAAEAGQAVGKAAKLVDFANRVSFGRASAPQATVGGLDVTTLHQRVAGELAALKAQAAAEKKTLEESRKTNQELINQLKTQTSAARERAAAERTRKKAGSETELLARADAADREADFRSRRAAELEEQIAELKATAGPTPNAAQQQQIDGGMARKKSAEDERDKQAALARDLRRQAAAAAAIEVAAVKIDAEAKGYEDQSAVLEQKNQQTAQRIAEQPKAIAKAARDILERYRKLVDLLQEGITTAPAGAGTGASPGVSVPAHPTSAVGGATFTPRTP